MEIESYIMLIPCQASSLIFHESLHISYQFYKHPIILNPWTSPIHTHHASHALSRSNHPKYINHTRIGKGNRTWCILAQPLAQAEGSRSGEGSKRGTVALWRTFPYARPPHLSETCSRSKLELIAWATARAGWNGRVLLVSLRRDRSLGRDMQDPPLFTHAQTKHFTHIKHTVHIHSTKTSIIHSISQKWP